MFKHIFLTRIKCVLRERVNLFWLFIFPIVLTTLFHFAFGNLAKLEGFEPIKIAYVEKSGSEINKEFKEIITTLNNGKDKIFDVTYTNVEEANKLLKDGEIDGYIYTEDEIKLNINNNGYNQTIAKTILENYIVNKSAINSLYQKNPEKIGEILLRGVDFNHNFVQEKNVNNTDPTVIYFYSLIGMVCLYSGFYGIRTMNLLEANLSVVGARNSLSPLPKLKMLFPMIIVDILIMIVCLLLLIGYMMLLGVDFGNQLLLVAFIAIICGICGIGIGMLVGVSNRRSEDTKTGFLVVVTMLLSFFAGMMNADIKYSIAENMPLLAKINPVNLLSDGLYSLYYYDDLTKYWNSVIGLLVFIVIVFSITYFFLRRKKYESL